MKLSFIGFLLIFFFLLIWKKKYGLQLIIFTIPFSLIYIPTSGILKNLPISLTSILVFAFYILTYTKKNNYTPNIYFKILYYLLLFVLIWGTLFTPFYYHDALGQITYSVGQTQLSLLKPLFQVVYHSSNIIFCILLLNILRHYFEDQKNVKDAAYVFSITVIIMFISQLLEMYGIRTFNILYEGDLRYLGLYTIFGLGVYVSMVVTFSLIFKFRHYRILIVTALLYGLFSAERQALLLPIIILLVYYLFSNISILKKIMTLLIFVISLYVLLFVLKDTFYGVTRLWDGFNTSKETSILEATGRGGSAQTLFLIKQALLDWPITGKGIYNWGYFKGVRSIFADHVVLINLYQKFGLFGFLIFTIAILRFTFLLFKYYLSQKRDRSLLLSFGLMITFIGQQFLDNFFWFTNTMLLYIFMFSIIFILLVKYKGHTFNQSVEK